MSSDETGIQQPSKDTLNTLPARLRKSAKNDPGSTPCATINFTRKIGESNPPIPNEADKARILELVAEKLLAAQFAVEALQLRNADIRVRGGVRYVVIHATFTCQSMK